MSSVSVPVLTGQNRDTRRPTPVHPPVPPAPAWNWLLTPTNGRGYLQINGRVYQTTEIGFTYENGTGGRLWDLMLADGKSCRVCQNADGDLACDCEDSVYRQRRCKHSQAIEGAYADLDRQADLDRFLAAEPTVIICEPGYEDCPLCGERLGADETIVHDRCADREAAQADADAYRNKSHSAEPMPF